MSRFVFDKVKWGVAFSYVDRSELLGALRNHQAWWEEAVANASLIDEHDPDTIQATIHVANLDELRELLVATKDVRSHWGAVLTMHADGGEQFVSASLAAKESEYVTSDVTLRVMPPKDGANPLYDKISNIRKQLGDVLNEIQKGGA